uniref:Uncharacterized protein n=1 Tax=Timema tahoe TaxID=61484 RepID=A0A7R9II53_9NEOP|nr:unnamed protein product [Timema tahoe]
METKAPVKPQDHDAQKEEEKDEEEEEDELENELTSTVNYNTISSLMALKELLHGDSSDDDMAWFEHYFLHHVDRLPKQELRSPFLQTIIEGRRLSECREEEEDIRVDEDYEDDAGTKDSEDPSEEALDDDAEASREPNDEGKPVLVTSARGKKFMVSAVTNNSASPTRVGSSPGSPLKRRHTMSGRTQSPSPSSAESGFPPIAPYHRSSPLPSPHLDKRFFDSSLIEMKSQASSSSTIDNDSSEDIWVMRNEVAGDTARRKKPENVVEYFEEYSRKLKEARFRPETDHLQDFYIPPEDFELANKLMPMFEVQVISLKEEAEAEEEAADLSVETTQPDLMELMFFFEQAGVGLPRHEMFLIALAISKLSQSQPVEKVRFWGRILGTKKNYIIAESEFTEEELGRRATVEHLSSTVIVVVRASIPKPSPNPRHHPVPLWIEECRFAISNRQRALRLFHRHPTKENLESFQILLARPRRIIREGRRES